MADDVPPASDRTSVVDRVLRAAAERAVEAVAELPDTARAALVARALVELLGLYQSIGRQSYVDAVRATPNLAQLYDLQAERTPPPEVDPSAPRRGSPFATRGRAATSDPPSEVIEGLIDDIAGHEGAQVVRTTLAAARTEVERGGWSSRPPAAGEEGAAPARPEGERQALATIGDAISQGASVDVPPPIPAEPDAADHGSPPAPQGVAEVLAAERLRPTLPPFTVSAAGSTRGSFAQPTAASRRLAAHLQTLDGGSIGIAGPRGIGKSVLMQAAVDGELLDDDQLGVLIQAPVAYDSLEVLTSLFSSVVDAVQDAPVDDDRARLTDSAPSHDAKAKAQAAFESLQDRLNLTNGTYALTVLEAVAGHLIAIAALVATWFLLPHIVRPSTTVGTLRSVAGLVAGAIGASATWTVRAKLEIEFAQRLALDRALHRSKPRAWSELTFTQVDAVAGACVAIAAYCAAKLGNAAYHAVGHPPRWLDERYHRGLGDARLTVAVAGLAVAGGIGTLVGRRRRSLRDTTVRQPLRAALADHAAPKWLALALAGEEHRRRLLLQTTVSKGSSGGLDVAPGILKASVGSTRETSTTDRPLSHPEAVDLFRRYLLDVTDAYGRVVIGIDEVDKIAIDEDAARFLNGTKALFGVSRAFYLVSVSDSAVASFERRGLPFRDAFDSCFDDIVRVDEFPLLYARFAVDRRAVPIQVGGPAGASPVASARRATVSDPFLWVAFVLSGGLGRDLVRLLRRMGSADGAALTEAGELDLVEVTERIVRREIRDRASGTAERLGRQPQASGAGGPSDASTSAWALFDRAHESGSFTDLEAEVLDQASAAASATADVRGLRAYAALAITAAAMVATDERRCAVDPGPGENPSLDSVLGRLAEARRLLGIDPMSAISWVSDVRSTLGLGAIPPPRSVRVPPVGGVDGR